jgi:hypothetical protein
MTHKNNLEQLSLSVQANFLAAPLGKNLGGTHSSD